MILRVKVKPNSKIESIETVNRQENIGNKEIKMVVKLKQKAEKGKANLALIKALSKHLDVPMSSIRIVKGIKSRDKIIVIKN